MLFIVLKPHLLLVLFIKSEASLPCDLVVFEEKSSFQKPGEPDCGVCHLYVEASVLSLLNEGSLAVKGELIGLNEDQRCVVKEVLEHAVR